MLPAFKINFQLGVSENKDVLFFSPLKGPMCSIHSLLRYFWKGVLIGIRIPKSSMVKDTWNMLCWTRKTSSFIAELLRSSKLFWISKGAVFKQFYQGTRAPGEARVHFGEDTGRGFFRECSVTEPSGDIEEFHPPNRGHPCASAKVLEEDICLSEVFSACCEGGCMHICQPRTCSWQVCPLGVI